MRRSLLLFLLLLCSALFLRLLLHGGRRTSSAITRKMLTAKSDDLYPYSSSSLFGTRTHARHRHQHGHRLHRRAPRGRHSAGSIIAGALQDNGDEIDPQYGVEKRLVPTGPNPLHH
ncbi:hypothetical protein Cni_G22862 [Canna indica]|uniref:Uncharacterized protein n=1 Tax=Canna indica TaxID=4628 RepID=A0AAQ3KS17_9LILI|nr:hypothetical protein Cni_G22862 [Canna indica]